MWANKNNFQDYYQVDLSNTMRQHGLIILQTKTKIFIVT